MKILRDLSLFLVHLMHLKYPSRRS